MLSAQKKTPLIATLLGVSVILILLLTPKTSQSRLGTPDPTPEEAPNTAPASAQVNLLFTGTTFWGRNTNKIARASDLGVKYPFSQLDTLDRNSYDAWIGGLECPITDQGHTDHNEDTLLLFNCDPDYLPEAAKWFTAFSLGNNHTDNMGTDGFATTKTYLDEIGIQYFGHYDYHNTTEICAPIAIPARLIRKDGSEKNFNLTLGLCGIHGVFGIPTEAALQEIQRYAKILPTIVMPHMGAEYKAESDTLRQNIYRKIIDYGAEMVIGDHPHWIQSTEAYNGKLIVYSMGNFMFDQLWSAETSRSAAITATAEFTPDIDYITWDNLTESCLISRQTCLAKIKSANLPRLHPIWTFAYHGTTSAITHIPRLASPAEQSAIGARLNWITTIKNLK